MKVPFYILGLLIRYGEKSGYSLKQIIERDIADFASIKLPTIYYHLDKLLQKNYVTMKVDKDGNRPEKQVYSITESGKKYFEILIMKQLNEKFQLEFSMDGILYFRDMLNDEVFIEALNKKRKQIEDQIKGIKMHKENVTKNMRNDIKGCACAIFDHHIIHLEAEILWINNVLEVNG